MKVLITGAAGFLGCWLARALQGQGHEVVGYDNLCGGSKENIPPSCLFYEGDILDEFLLTTAMHGCQAVYHCAALAYEGLSVFSPRLIAENIAVGTLTVALAALRNNVRRLVNCSSMARYGANDTPFTEAMLPAPVDPYGVCKVAAEQQLTILGRVHGLEVLHAVPHNIIGPRQCYTDPYRNVASIMIHRLLKDRPVVIYGDGRQTRCFSPIQDVLPTLVQLLDCPALHGEVFNVGPDEGAISILALAGEVARAVGKPLLVEHHPARPCEVRQAWCSSDKIRRRFGYQASTTLPTSLQEMVAYIRQQGLKPFRYHLPLEITSAQTPRTWKEQLF